MERLKDSPAWQGHMTLLLGPARAGKTTLLVREYLQQLASCSADFSLGASAWICPSQTAVEQIRDLLAAVSERALLRPQVVTFATFADAMVARSPRRIRSINRLEKQRILQHVIAELHASKRLPYFHQVAHTPGLVRMVDETIAELKRRDVWAEEFSARPLPPRERDIACIYEGYQQFLLANDLYDAEGRFWAVRELCEQGGAGHWGTVVVNGFTDFTPAQHDILRLLGQQGAHVRVSLLADRAHEPAEVDPGRALLFARSRRTRQLFERDFPRMEIRRLDDAQDMPSGFKQIQRDLFRDSPTDVGDATSDAISVIAADSYQGEIEEIARRMKRLLLAGVAQPDDILLIVRRFDEHRARIEQVFNEFGLPATWCSTPVLAGQPLVRTLLKLLELHRRDWPFELLLDTIGNRLLNPRGNTSADSASAKSTVWRAAVERCIRRVQLPAGRTLLLEVLQGWAQVPTDAVSSGDSQSEANESDATVALQVLKPLDEALASLPQRASLAAWAAASKDLLTALNCMTGGSEWNSLIQALTRVVRIDDQLGKSDEQLTCKQFVDTLTWIAGEVSLPRTGDRIGRIRITTSEAARPLSARHVFVAQLSEDSFSPSRSRLADLDLNDRPPDADRAASSLELVGDAMLLFYETVTRATRSLTLSYPALDEKGEALPPSPFLTELLRCFPRGAIPTTTMPAGRVADSTTEPFSPRDWRLKATKSALAGSETSLAALAQSTKFARVGASILDGLECVASRSQREGFGPYEGVFGSEKAQEVLRRRYGSAHLWSPSQLETYAACPFLFLGQQLLRLQPVDELTLRSDHLRRGSLLHQVLATIHETALGVETEDGESELVERFERALTQIIQRTPLQGLDEALREIECREITSWAPHYARQERDYRQQWQSHDQPPRPAFLEVRFGSRASGGSDELDQLSTTVPFELDLATEQIRLTGQIDRIDVGQVAGVTVFNIIDYKSGKQAKLSEDEIIGGRQLQLPLYAMAAESLLLADRSAVPWATGYWSVQGKGFAKGKNALLQFHELHESQLASTERWQKLKQAITARVSQLVQGIRAAEFPVYNDQQTCTQTCDLSKICRIAQIRSLEKIWIPEQTE